jgi:hypothetical protein
VVTAAATDDYADVYGHFKLPSGELFNWKFQIRTMQYEGVPFAVATPGELVVEPRVHINIFPYPWCLDAVGLAREGQTNVLDVLVPAGGKIMWFVASGLDAHLVSESGSMPIKFPPGKCSKAR